MTNITMNKANQVSNTITASRRVVRSFLPRKRERKPRTMLSRPATELGGISSESMSKMNGNTKLSSPEIIATKAMIRVKTTFVGG
jgi:hypothetical protein